MVERYVDSLKEAASRCRELISNKESERPEIYVKLIQALKVGAGSAHQLSMAQMNPRFLFVRDTLEAFTDFCQSNIFKDSQSKVWLTIAGELDKLHITGLKMAEAKALSRQVVLEELDQRQKALDIS